MLADRQFRLFWSARTVSVAGSSVSLVALPVLVFDLTGSAALTGLLATLEFLPYLLFGLVAGAVADRANRRQLMISTDVLNAVLLGSVPAAAALGVLTAGQVLTVAFLSSCAFVWFDAANFGAVPALVGRARLVPAMSALNAATTAAEVLGPAVTGLLTAGVGPTVAVAVDAASYLASGLLLCLVRRPLNVPGAAREPSAGATPVRLRADVVEGLRFLWNQRLVRAMTITTVGLSVTGGAVLGLLVVYAVRALHVPATDPRVGLLFAAGAGGALATSLLLPWLSDRYRIGRITLAGVLGNLAALLALAGAGNYPAALLALAAYEGTYNLVTLNGITTRQLLTPEHLAGRVNVTARMLGVAGRPVGAAAGGLLASVLPIRTALLVAALGVLASFALGSLSVLRTSPLTAAAVAGDAER